ncbi:DUF427 domain-containing protein [Pelagibius litoralis]|uniref:DUF427 domain-containing protein n=1 Tax=Pelagibius litoralis TaxID=374515 RepID=A0A967F0U2_9PROT|nr:DUF427 domain-containing protein [Pelagibius litoralis]NIA70922.1 DUF427 domain-containing protein [Pelagibius litoralis]
MTEQEHNAHVSPADAPYVAKVGGTVIARSDRAVILQEVSPRKTYPPVIYFPLEDVEQRHLLASDHHSFCPIKGDAGYYSLRTGGETLENAVWFYPDPLPMVAGVKGHVAFYPDRVTVEKV